MNLTLFYSICILALVVICFFFCVYCFIFSSFFLVTTLCTYMNDSDVANQIRLITLGFRIILGTLHIFLVRSNSELPVIGP